MKDPIKEEEEKEEDGQICIAKISKATKEVVEKLTADDTFKEKILSLAITLAVRAVSPGPKEFSEIFQKLLDAALAANENGEVAFIAIQKLTDEQMAEYKKPQGENNDK